MAAAPANPFQLDPNSAAYMHQSMQQYMQQQQQAQALTPAATPPGYSHQPTLQQAPLPQSTEPIQLGELAPQIPEPTQLLQPVLINPDTSLQHTSPGCANQGEVVQPTTGQTFRIVVEIDGAKRDAIVTLGAVLQGDAPQTPPTKPFKAGGNKTKIYVYSECPLNAPSKPTPAGQERAERPPKGPKSGRGSAEPAETKPAPMPKKKTQAQENKTNENTAAPAPSGDNQPAAPAPTKRTRARNVPADTTEAAQTPPPASGPRAKRTPRGGAEKQAQQPRGSPRNTTEGGQRGGAGNSSGNARQKRNTKAQQGNSGN